MATQTQAEKAKTFRALHERDRAFIIPNPWDVGTARLLRSFGFEALATTSAGFAFSIGLPDGAVDRTTMLDHAASIVRASDLPVSADLEDGYGTTSSDVAETIRKAVAVGLAGCSVEDVPNGRGLPPFDIDVAADRVRAAAQVISALDFPFTLTARAENFIVGRPDLSDTIKRLQAFEAAGADVLFAPGLTTRDDIVAVIRAVNKPVNVIMGLAGVRLNLRELSDMGVKRVSVGSALARAALAAFLSGAEEMRDRGTFEFAEAAVKSARMNEAFAPYAGARAG